MLLRLVIVVLVLGSTGIAWSAGAQDSPDPEATIAALQTEVAQLQGATGTATPTTAATPDDQPQEMALASESDRPVQPRTVNLEIILDDSGSMGQIIDTGETRLEAAKRVLNEVIAAIPVEPGINVGLRIYGHEGDNTDAGRSVSCEASDLVVPVSGVDQAAIARQIAPLVPIGWTPIGLSLERSEADFPEATELESTNAVVLVTDGLETCGGDPAGTAAALVASDKVIVTHVIGFALVPEEQQILESITAASGGMLLSAANATELTGALFTILDELDVIKGAGLIGGSALSLLPPGEPGTFSIVAMGTYDGNTLPFVVRNNTGEPMVSLSATGEALNAAGQLISTGGDQLLTPNLVRSGGLSLGYIYFGGADLPPDTTFRIEVEGTPAAEDEFENQRDLEVVEAAFVDGRVVGTLRNGYDEIVHGPFGVHVGCFDQSGALIDLEKVYAPEDDADPGDQVTFQAPLFGTLDCPLFLVAGGGFSRSLDRQHKASDILTAEPDHAPASQATPEQSSADDGAPADPREPAMLAQEPLPGYTDVASRYFRFTDGGVANPGFIWYCVLEFETAELADDALEETASRYQAVSGSPLENLLPAQPPDLGDRAIAFTGDSSDQTSDMKLGIVAIRVGSRIHFLVGSQLNQSPLPLMEEATVEGLLPADQRAGGGQTVTGLNTGGLWDVVPRPEDLGEGFSVNEELVPKMFGPLATVGIAGTPEAAPTPPTESD